MIQPSCYLCNCSRSVILFTLKEYIFCRCVCCGLVYLWPQPTNLGNTYNIGYYRDRSVLMITNTNRFIYEGHLKQLESLVPSQHRRLLDIGCGAGCFMDMARSRGWNVEGIDISVEVAQYAREHYHLNIHLGDLQQLPKQTYDVITLWDVLEHLPKPLEQLSQAYQLLKPNGILAISTPNIAGIGTRLNGRNSPIFNPMEHLYYFSINTLHQLLVKTGFRPIKCITDTIYIKNIASLLSKTTHSKRASLFYRHVNNMIQGRISIYGINLMNKILRLLSLGDQIVVFARKS